jgi:hypothetical protein
MYESPIRIIESTINSILTDLNTQKEDAIILEVQRSLGVDVDKEELLRALQYDRFQYDKGYADGRADAMAEVVRCRDCAYWQDNNSGYPHEECRWGHGETPDADDFCSYGERKEGEWILM